MTDHDSKQSRTRTLVECAMLVALSAVLSLILKFKFLPYGGSVTLCSMVPAALIAYRSGLGWGLLSGLAIGIFRMLTGMSGIGGMTPFSTLMILLIDYLLAFTALGIAGMFRGKMKQPRNELMLGALAAMALRYLFHVLSGFIFFSEYAEWFFGEAGDFGAWILRGFSGAGLGLVYSLCYNATYMIPETVITAAACYLLSLALPGLLKKRGA